MSNLFSPVFVVAVMAVILAAGALVLNYRLRQTIRKFFLETGHEEFGEVLLAHQRQLRRGHEGIKNLDQRLSFLETESNFLLNKVGLVKYNPFSDSGGNMSFSLAILNNNGDGAVVTSLHSREGTRIYAKAIKNYDCEQQLTKEEREAVEQTKRAEK